MTVAHVSFICFEKKKLTESLATTLFSENKIKREKNYDLSI